MDVVSDARLAGCHHRLVAACWQRPAAGVTRMAEAWCVIRTMKPFSGIGHISGKQTGRVVQVWMAG